MLKQAYHQYNSQKNESINQLIATVAPKNKTFSKTKSLEDRINLVIILDSIGYELGVERLFDALAGEKNTLLEVMEGWLQCKDVRKEKV